MHPGILEVSKKIGVEIAERDAWESWGYDGRTIASYTDYLFWNEENFPEEDPPRGRRHYFSDADILHELGHYLAASEEQRYINEFGLDIGRHSFGPKGGSIRDLDGNFLSHSIEGFVNKKEQDIQETVAQLLSIYWGQKYNIVCEFGFEKWSIGSWEDYFKFKIITSDGLPLRESRFSSYFQLSIQQYLLAAAHIDSDKYAVLPILLERYEEELLNLRWQALIRFRKFVKEGKV